jgi:hypothetical protein
VVPGRPGEHVDDERAVVEQDPFGRLAALDAQRTEPGRLEPGLDRLGDGQVLPRRIPVPGEDKGGERGDLAEVEDAEVLGLPRARPRRPGGRAGGGFSW